MKLFGTESFPLFIYLFLFPEKGFQTEELSTKVTACTKRHLFLFFPPVERRLPNRKKMSTWLTARTKPQLFLIFPLDEKRLPNRKHEYLGNSSCESHLFLFFPLDEKRLSNRKNEYLGNTSYKRHLFLLFPNEYSGYSRFGDNIL